MNQRRNRWAVLAVVMLVTACASNDPVANPAALGMRVSDGFFDGDAFDDAERWLNADINYTVQFTGRQDPQDMNGSAFGMLASEDADLPRYVDDLTLSIAVPLGFGTANARDKDGRAQVANNLRAVADGQVDEAYVRVATRLVEAGYDDAIIRLGHEFSGAWAPWSSRTNEEVFIAAWRHVHGVLRGVSPGFEFDWTTTRPAWFEWGSAAYPGDDYVDIVGMDVYWRALVLNEVWDSNTFEREFLQPMRDHANFAASHGKQLSYPEWGISDADSPDFVVAMHDWFAGLPSAGPGALRYHAYFNSGDAFGLDQFPAVSRQFRDSFGG